MGGGVILPYSVHQWIGKLNSNLFLLKKPRFKKKLRTTRNYCHVCDFSAGLVIDSGGLLVGGGTVCRECGVLELLMGFRDLTP